MTIPTLEVLTAFPSRDLVRTKLLSYWQAAELPITDWEPGAFMRSLLELTERGISDAGGGAIPTIVAGGFPESNGKPGASDWIELVAEQWFGRDRVKATFATQTVVLTCDGAHGPYTITAGVQIVYSPTTGNRYFAATGGTLNTSSTLTITVKAEMSNESIAGHNYVDTANTLTALVTPLAGVTVNNPPPNFSAVTTTPSPATGKGVVTVGGTPAANPTTYELIVTTSGQKAAAEMQSRVNGGAWSAVFTMGASYVFPSSGPTATFTDDPGGTNPSFIVGDMYSFTSPGSPITAPGFDKETDAKLLARCFARWPSLEAGGVEEKRARWAKLVDPLITRARVFATGVTYPGRAEVVIAGVTNPLAGGIATAVDLYIKQHDSIGDRTIVTIAGITTITPGGHVNVQRGNKSAVQAAATVLWNAYVLSTDIGGIVRISELVQALMDAGALDVGAPAGGALTINTFAANFQLAADKVAQPASLITNLTWNEI
jgi:hypothetical protein